MVCVLPSTLCMTGDLWPRWFIWHQDIWVTHCQSSAMSFIFTQYFFCNSFRHCLLRSCIVRSGTYFSQSPPPCPQPPPLPLRPLMSSVNFVKSQQYLVTYPPCLPQTHWSNIILLQYDFADVWMRYKTYNFLWVVQISFKQQTQCKMGCSVYSDKILSTVEHYHE